MSSPYQRALARLLAAPTRPKFGLERMAELLRKLGDPQRSFRSLHVAGTKGKGSTCAFADALCAAAGLRRGMTISPHLCCARERIVIDGEMISEAHFTALEQRVNNASIRMADAPSFFERTIAMAFLAFAQARVDVAIVEVGMGGRLDATNLCVPAACAITQLGIDHTAYLGTTIEAIAAQKAGICKPQVPLFTIDHGNDASMAVLQHHARSSGAPLQVVPPHAGLLGLHGRGQAHNAALAVALVRTIVPSLSDDNTVRGLANVRWPCRMEWLGDVLLDGAHNDLSAAALSSSLLTTRPLHGVVGMSEGHDERTFFEALNSRQWQSFITTAVPHPRAQSPRSLARAAVSAGAAVVDVVGWPHALEVARRRAADDGGVVVVTGSLFVAGGARALLVPGMPCDDVWPLF
jgi:dihydrofolate synthase / folylpolyglutamate synthase